MIKKFYLTVFVFVASFIFGQSVKAPSQGQNLVPGFGGGSTGPGVRAKAPIDMYIYILAIVAIVAIWYYAKKYKTQLK